MVARRITRWLLVLFYLAGGIAHLVLPAPFVSITPGWVPRPAVVVLLTGLAELLGALALAQGWSAPLRKLAGAALAAYALCVWPANYHHMVLDLARPGHGLGLVYHLPRLAFQPVLIWAALWCVRLIHWPFARPPRRKRRHDRGRVLWANDGYYPAGDGDHGGVDPGQAGKPRRRRYRRRSVETS